MANGHKVAWRSFFTSGHAADDLAKHVKLRPGDKKKYCDGTTKWQRQVGQTITNWLKGSRDNPEYFGPCPFELYNGRNYQIKEGWQWRNEVF